MGKISFVLHGKTRGKSHLIREIERVFKSRYQLEYYETKHADHAEKLTIKALSDGCDFLIAIGGDGTLNEVVNGYMKSGGMKASQTAIGILPWGTGNDFVRSSGNQKSVDHLGQLIDSKSIRMIDIGQVTYGALKGNQRVRYFDNIADLGIGAEIVSKVNAVHLRKVILGGTLLFYFTAIRIFLMYRHKQVKVTFDDQVWEGKLLSLVIANGRFFGSGLGVAPDAQLDDGKFQVIIFGDLSVFDYLKHYGKIRKSKKLDLPDVLYHTAKQVSVEAFGRDAVLEADGEVGSKAPVSFDCLHQVLPLIAPVK